MSVSIDNEELKACLLKGCESTFIDKEDVVLEVFDKFFFEKEDENDTLTHPTKCGRLMMSELYTKLVVK